MRTRRIDLTGKLLKQMTRTHAGRSLLRMLQQSRITSRSYRALAGYNRPFASLAEAEATLAAYSHAGHESPANAQHHLELSATARPSDYAAFFHLAPEAPLLSRVFDLGGNAGNLFYTYTRYLALPSSLRWTVLDLPANMETGRALAQQRGIDALRFTSDWHEAEDTDLLLVSGSLHYLPTPLPEMLAALPTKPARVLINRTPLTDGPATAAVQTASGFRLACMLYNRGELLDEVQALGYTLVDEWKAAELSMQIPGYPEYSIPAYSGAYLRLSNLPPAPSQGRSVQVSLCRGGASAPASGAVPAGL